MTNLIGQTLGSYQILEQIGMGGMATVYKAYQPSMDRHVAVKVLPRHFMQDPTFVERFEREARTVARLEHPHILPVHDYGKEEDGTTYLVMRYIEAGTLADMLRRGPLTQLRAIKLFEQIADALAYAHEQDVIHRDMKPSNVLVNLRGHPFLTDFGLARMVEGDSNLTGSMILGTPTYMAPELGQGEPADRRSDIYALGIILYQMITGRPPYEAETPLAVMIKHMTEPLPPPKTLNPAIDDNLELVILKTLAKNPKDRYQSIPQLIKDLREPAKIELTSPTHEVSPVDSTPPPAPEVSPSELLPTTPIHAPESSQPTQPEIAQPATSTEKTNKRHWLKNNKRRLGIGGLLLLLCCCLLGIINNANRKNQQPREVGQIARSGATPTLEAMAESDTETFMPPSVVATSNMPSANPTGTSPIGGGSSTTIIEAESSSNFPFDAEWTQFTNSKEVHQVIAHNNFVWLISEGGLVAWDIADNTLEKLTTADGLPFNEAYTALVDANNRLWVGGRGLMYFDSENWYPIEHPLLENRIFYTLIETSEEHIIAGSGGAEDIFIIFDGTTWDIFPSPLLPAEYVVPYIMFEIEDNGALVLAFEEGGGLYYFLDETWNTLTTDDGLPSNFILAAIPLPNEEALIATDIPGGIVLFDGETFQRPNIPPNLSNVIVTALYETNDGSILLGTTDKGLWEFDDGEFNLVGDRETLPEGFISSIIEDEDGVIWLGMQGVGLVGLDGEEFFPLILEDEPPLNTAQQIVEGPDDKIWFLDHWGDRETIIANYNPQTNEWDAVNKPDNAQVIAVDIHNIIWIGTDNGLLGATLEGEPRKFTDQNGLPHNKVISLAPDVDGGLWVGTESGLAYYNPQNPNRPWRAFPKHFTNHTIDYLYTDIQGITWIAATKHGNQQINTDLAQAINGNIIKTWPKDDEIPSQVKDITAITTDFENNVWIGTQDNHLWRLTNIEGQNEWTQFTSGEYGLPGSILSLAATPDGWIWIGTWYENLWVFNPETGETKDFLMEDNLLPGRAIFDIHLTQNGNLWIATEAGLVGIR